MILKVKDIRNESIDELASRLENMKRKHMELRFSHASGTLKNPLDLRIIKKDIARILSVINEKKADPRLAEEELQGKKEPGRKKLSKRKITK